jgi:predicted short-subunit dehydrogenase-like oxidoreductase (DUF2520 family)
MKKTILIGKGNLGTHLAALFRECHWDFEHHAFRTFDFEKSIDRNTCVWLCISDQFIPATINKIIKHGCSVIYCSGGLAVLPEWADCCSVFYPLYSFKKDQPITWQKVPVFIDDQQGVHAEYFNDVLNKTGLNWQRCTSIERLNYHLAAVFINNFGNALLCAVEQISPKITREQLVQALMPIALQTVERWSHDAAVNLQTGPASRGDQVVLETHLDLLKEFPLEHKLYQFHTDYIQEIIKQKITQKDKKSNKSV